MMYVNQYTTYIAIISKQRNLCTCYVNTMLTSKNNEF